VADIRAMCAIGQRGQLGLNGRLPWEENKGRVLLEVAPGEELLYGVGLAGGAGLLEVSLDRGQLGELALVRFIRVGPRVLLEQRQTFHRSGASDRERTRVVEESFPSSVLGAFESGIAGRTVTMQEVLSSKVSAYQDSIDEGIEALSVRA